MEIRVEDLFTVVMVNNLRLMFNRLTGRFDGLIIETDDCHGSPVRAGTGYSAPTPK